MKSKTIAKLTSIVLSLSILVTLCVQSVCANENDFNEQQILEDYSEYIYNKYHYSPLPVNELKIHQNYGEFNNYSIVSILNVYEDLSGVEVYRKIGGHTFKFPHSNLAYNIYAAGNGEFYEIGDAYDNGKFTSNDIEAIGKLTGYYTSETPEGILRGKLSEEKKAEIEKDFANSSIALSNPYTNNPKVSRYYCSFKGYDILIIDDFEAVECVWGSMEIAGYYFHFAYEAYKTRFFAYKDGVFIKMKDAYESGIFSEEDIRRISVACDNNGTKFKEDFSTWSASQIKYTVKNGIMNGVADDSFEHSRNTRRCEFITVLWRLAGMPSAESSHPFTDVDPRQTWYHEALDWAYENGIVNGVSATEFKPNARITREQMITMLFRFNKYEGHDVSAREDISVFEDSSEVSDFAKDAISWGYAEGIIAGALNNNKIYIYPDRSATRESTAVMAARYCYKNNKF